MSAAAPLMVVWRRRALGITTGPLTQLLHNAAATIGLANKSFNLSYAGNEL